MTRVLSFAAFFTGMALIALMARSVAVDDSLTLLVMLLIAAGYAIGGAELWRYQRHTEALRSALSALGTGQSGAAESPSLDAWLSTVPAALRDAVRQRIVGQFQGLPAPVLTPYLTGLLVMLGLMGTFIGMVATLGGAALALEGGTELTAIRQGLAAPIQGLGMAFGTSVAGVAASAMLGLIATLSTRARLQVSRLLDHHRDESFQADSLSYQRTQAYSALQQQSSALPDAVVSLGALSEQLGRAGEQLVAWSERTGEQLLTQQREFESAVRADFQKLVAELGSSLSDNLASTGKEAAETLQPFVGQLLEQASERLAGEAAARHEAEQQLRDVLRAQQAEQLESRRVAEAQWRSTISEGTDTLVASLSNQLDAIQTVERERLDDSQTQITALQQSLGQQLQAMVASMDQSVAAMQIAARESTDASSDLIRTLQQSTDQSLARDAALLEERSGLLQQQSDVMARLHEQGEAHQTLQQNMQGQFEEFMHEQSTTAAQSLDRLVAQSAQQLTKFSGDLAQEMTSTLEGNKQQWQQVSNRLGEELDQLLVRNGETLEQLADNVNRQLGDSGQQVAEAARDLTSLTGSFAGSVAAFEASSGAVATSLASISEVLVTSGARSDEQMGYYVDQAREIIDHNLMTQQTILERLEAVTGALQAEAASS